MPVGSECSTNELSGQSEAVPRIQKPVSLVTGKLEMEPKFEVESLSVSDSAICPSKSGPLETGLDAGDWTGRWMLLAPAVREEREREAVDTCRIFEIYERYGSILVFSPQHATTYLEFSCDYRAHPGYT